MDHIQDIKNRLNIEDVIGSYITLKKAGRNFKACCPFHNEKTGSFVVSPEKQIAHCFGCHWGGDVIKFVQDFEKTDFPETIEALAKRAGVTLPERSYSGQNKEQNAILKKIHTEAAKFYEAQLAKNEKIQKYLEDRGMKKETIETFQLGWAPDDYHETHKYLEKKGFKKADLVKAGLASKKHMAGDEIYDRFRGRIIFPIWDNLGAIIAFGGRTLSDAKDVAKYLNSPDTPIYNKGKHCYGFHLGKDTLREKGNVIIVEGYFDVISLHQAGYKNTVASCGTALTENQLKTLQRFVTEVIFSFDADPAGQSAAKRSIALAQEFGCNIKVLQIPEGKDPDDCVQQDPQMFQQALEKRVPYMDYVIDSAIEENDMTSIEGKKKCVKVVLENIARIPNAVEKEHYMNKLSKLVGSSVHALGTELSKEKGIQPPKKEEKPAESDPQRGKYHIEDLILSLIVSQPSALEHFGDTLTEADFSLESAKSLYKKILDHYNLGDLNTDLESHFEGEERQKVLVLTLIGQEYYKALSQAEKEKELTFLMKKLKETQNKSRIQTLKDKLIEAKDNKETQNILQELNSLISNTLNSQK